MKREPAREKVNGAMKHQNVYSTGAQNHHKSTEVSSKSAVEELVPPLLTVVRMDSSYSDNR